MCRHPLGHSGVFVLSPVQVYIAAGQSYELESKLRRLEQSAKNRFGGTTDSELSELEDVVALTAARVQSAESEVGPDTPVPPDDTLSDDNKATRTLSVGLEEKIRLSVVSGKKTNQLNLHDKIIIIHIIL